MKTVALWLFALNLFIIALGGIGLACEIEFFVNFAAIIFPVAITGFIALCIRMSLVSGR